MPISAFLSHSSANRPLVVRLHDELGPGATWLDRAEIEWGDVFLEKIEEGIKSASDFVLFWSEASAQSHWVRLELHMALIQALRQRGIRLRVIRLDRTPLPLYLEPFNYLDVSRATDQFEAIFGPLKSALEEPTRGARHRILNRNEELARIESSLDDDSTRVIILVGFQGIGKTAVAEEALRRFFDIPSSVHLRVNPGVGSAELALRLHAEATGATMPETLDRDELLKTIAQSVDVILAREQFLILGDIQHWLDEDRKPMQPLVTVLERCVRSSEATRRPLLLTSTRRPDLSVEHFEHTVILHVDGLADEHVATLLQNWFELFEGNELARDQAERISPHLFGHPIAAKLAANLVAKYGPDHLLSYPKELTVLRRDLARTLVQDLRLSDAASSLMETLAMANEHVSARLAAAASKLDDNGFQNAVSEAASSGLIERADDGKLAVHPLLGDYFWRARLHRSNYRETAREAAVEFSAYLDTLDAQGKDALEFVKMLPVVLRLYALAGELELARAIRRDLNGELAQAAITHYDRRQYDLADRLIQYVLDDYPSDWRMRLYRARIRVRQERWEEADQRIKELLSERPHDVRVRFTQGWRFLRAHDYEQALSIFLEVIASRDRHVQSINAAADCLHRLHRTDEALEFVRRSKAIESSNPFTADLEARILEDSGRLPEALEAARVAAGRDPNNGLMHHRVGRILKALGHRDEAISEFEVAIDCDPELYIARSSIVSTALDGGQIEKAKQHLPDLVRLAEGRSGKAIARHLEARIALEEGDIDDASTVIERELSQGNNITANLGLKIQIRLIQFDAADSGSAAARVFLAQAREAFDRCVQRPDNNPAILKAFETRILRAEDRMSG